MTRIPDRSRRAASSSGCERGSPTTLRDELAALRGKNLGDCASCGQPVYSAQSFTRFGGSVVHVRCPITARTFAPTLPSVLGAPVPARIRRRRGTAPR